MARAELKLENGTVVTVEGPPEEIHALLQFYGRASPSTAEPRSAKYRPRRASEKVESEDHEADRVHQVSTQVKSSGQFDAIESKILDQRSQLNRILLPLFIIHEEMDSAFGLTSGDIAKITRELGVPIGRPDVSKLLAKEASKYVMGDRTRVHGKPVRYKISRRGVQYIESLLVDRVPDSQ